MVAAYFYGVSIFKSYVDNAIFGCCISQMMLYVILSYVVMMMLYIILCYVILNTGDLKPNYH